MKNKLITIFILCIAVFACAQSVPTIGKYAPREHRGFYNSTSFGTAYNWFYNSLDDTDKYNDCQRHDVEFYEFNGGSFALGEFKFGVAIADLVAFHTVFNVGFFMGTVDYFNERYHESCTEVGCINVPEIENVDIPTSNDAYNFRTYFGFGATFYPIRDKNSPMNGFFVGGSLGYTLFVAVINGGHDSATGNGGFGFELETGKEWWINDRYAIGFGIGFAHSSLVWETVKSHKSDNVLSLSFRMTRG